MSCDVLLINTPREDYKVETTNYGYDDCYPVGLLLVSSSLRSNQIEPEFIDASFYRMPLGILIQKICDMNPKILGMNITFPNIEVIREICIKIHELNPDTKIVIGGSAVSLGTEYVLRRTGADVGVIGEGEQTFVQLCKAFLQGNDISNIPGIVYENNHVFQINKNTNTNPIDEVPFIDIQNIPIELRSVLEEITLFTSRGCVSNCSYCSTPAIWGKGIRTQSPRRIVEEINKFRNYGINFKRILFLDDNFTNSWTHVSEFMKIYKQEFKDIYTWKCLSRVKPLCDADRLQQMYDCGCRKILFGVESGNQNVLNRINKKMDLKDLDKLFAASKNVGIEKFGFFMLGFPGETKAELMDTVNMIINSGFDDIAISLVLAYPGTGLHKEMYGDKFVLPTFSHQVAKDASHPETKLSLSIFSDVPGTSLCSTPIEDLMALREYAYNEFYKRKSTISVPMVQAGC